MKIITKRDKIKTVLEEWKKQYPRGKGNKWDKITDKLSKLNFNECSEEEITKIIGNDSWTETRCNECQEDKDKIVMFLEEYEDDFELNTCYLCEDCLKKALMEISKEETKVIILDDNELSIMKYAEEYPENWKRICEALDKK